MMALLTLAMSPWIQVDALASDRVRRVEVIGDQITNVRTALGIATIIQVPDTPNSVVVGDQSAFKVEYLDRAITIKPLNMNAKSNLYVYTDWKRYNVQLTTGSLDAADYVVYLNQAAEKPKSVAKAKSVAMSFKNSMKNDGLTFSTIRLSKSHPESVLIEFQIHSEKRVTFQPECLWIAQEGLTKPIHNLILSAIEATPSRPIKGLIEIAVRDINPKNPFRIEIRRDKKSFLTVPEVTSWK